MLHQIATVINFCSNEYRFLKYCIKEAEKFSTVYITVCDHFFDGTKENEKLLVHVFNQFPNCQFIYYPYLLNRISKKLQKNIGDNFCCTLSRYIGYRFVDPSAEYILFLDADEIVDSRRFSHWLDHFSYKEYNVMRLANYWYFRSCCYRAKRFEDSPVFAKRRILKRKIIMQEGDRNAIYDNAKGRKLKMTLGLDDKPMVHHYSWVRTKEEMLKKVLSWGHRNERNWPELVEEEFSRPFNGTDFVHEYDFETVKPYVKIDLEEKETSLNGIPKQKLSEKTLLNMLQPWPSFSR